MYALNDSIIAALWIVYVYGYIMCVYLMYVYLFLLHYYYFISIR